jgi:hypothetical protein
MGTHRSGLTLGFAVTAAALGLVGCATPAGTSLTGASLTATSSTVRSHPPAMATAEDNGHTLTLTVGQRLSVRLDSTYWTFGPTAPPLRQNGQPLVSKGGPCVPGQGCGTVTADFYAAGPGRTAVSASRTSCGEAMRCVGPAGQYRLTIVVR